MLDWVSMNFSIKTTMPHYYSSTKYKSEFICQHVFEKGHRNFGFFVSVKISHAPAILQIQNHILILKFFYRLVNIIEQLPNKGFYTLVFQFCLVIALAFRWNWNVAIKDIFWFWRAIDHPGFSTCFVLLGINLLIIEL